MLPTELMTEGVAAIVHRPVPPTRPVSACRRRRGALIAHALAARRCKGVKPAASERLRSAPEGAILRPSPPQPSRCAGRASDLAVAVAHRRHGPARCRCSLTKTRSSRRLSPTSPSHRGRRWATELPPMSSIGDRPAARRLSTRNPPPRRADQVDEVGGDALLEGCNACKPHRARRGKGMDGPPMWTSGRVTSLASKEARSTVLSREDEAIIVAFRRHTLLPLDDCLYGLQPTRPHLTRSSLGDPCTAAWNSTASAGCPSLRATAQEAALRDLHDRHHPHRRCRELALAKAGTPRSSATTTTPHDQLRAHPHLFVDAYNDARGLRTLLGLTPYELIRQAWTKEPDRFRLNPSHLVPGPYILADVPAVRDGSCPCLARVVVRGSD